MATTARPRELNRYVAFQLMNEKRHVYAIIRLDRLISTPEDAVTVTKIVSSLDFAKSEVARLNKLNASKGATYFWQTTRMQVGDDQTDAK